MSPAAAFAKNAMIGVTLGLGCAFTYKHFVSDYQKNKIETYYKNLPADAEEPENTVQLAPFDLTGLKKEE